MASSGETDFRDKGSMKRGRMVDSDQVPQPPPPLKPAPLHRVTSCITVSTELTGPPGAQLSASVWTGVSWPPRPAVLVPEMLSG